MTDVWLVTCSHFPDGEPGGSLLEPLAARGVSAAWAVWDDPTVDWSAARLVAARATWDYQQRLPEFLDWARSLPVPLLNGAETFAWNADKSYLVELGAVIPTVPTRVVDLGGPSVVKPRVGASGVGVVVVPESVLVQPLVESVRTVGESSVYVFGGRAVSQFDKLPAPGSPEIRVHEEYGGSTVLAPLDPDRAALAEGATRVAGGPAYARVDVMLWQDAWVVSELELIEPGLYLDVDPVNAARFAELLVGVLGGQVPAVSGRREF